jgi:hypothetical protein
VRDARRLPRTPAQMADACLPLIGIARTGAHAMAKQKRGLGGRSIVADECLLANTIVSAANPGQAEQSSAAVLEDGC